MNEDQIDRYLFDEMSDVEREQLEDKFAGDEDLFVEVAERENELVDQYVAGDLTATELDRFERALKTHPAREKKIANAKALREFINSERTENKTITIAERSGFLSGLFGFRSPAFQFASVGIIVLLGLVSLLLLLENRRLESARTDLAAAREREAELNTRIENERDASAELTADLTAERERIEILDREIAKLRGSGGNSSTPNVTPPTIATLVLSSVGVRGGPAPAKRLELPAGIARIAIVINLPAETGERVAVLLNGDKVAENLRTQTKNGEKSVSIVVPVARIKDQRNSIQVSDTTGKTAEYSFSTSKP